MVFLHMYQNPGWFFGVLVLVSLWSLVWKGIALWKAAGRKELGWFIVLLVLNTAGILPIIYLLIKMDSPVKRGNSSRSVRASSVVKKSPKKAAGKKATRAGKRKVAKKTAKRGRKKK